MAAGEHHVEASCRLRARPRGERKNQPQEGEGSVLHGESLPHRGSVQLALRARGGLAGFVGSRLAACGLGLEAWGLRTSMVAGYSGGRRRSGFGRADGRHRVAGVASPRLSWGRSRAGHGSCGHRRRSTTRNFFAPHPYSRRQRRIRSTSVASRRWGQWCGA
jgi:hypothetical protein